MHNSPAVIRGSLYHYISQHKVKTSIWVVKQWAELRWHGMLWQDRAGKRFQLKAKEAFHDFVRLAIDQRNHLAQELFWRPALRTQIERRRKGWFNLWFIVATSTYWLSETSETCDCNHPTCNSIGPHPIRTHWTMRNRLRRVIRNAARKFGRIQTGIQHLWTWHVACPLWKSSLIAAHHEGPLRRI